MTGNPVVARKLVFILNGLIPNLQPVKISEVDNLVENNANGEDHAVKPITIQKLGHDQNSESRSLSCITTTTRFMLYIRIFFKQLIDEINTFIQRMGNPE